MSVPPHKGSGKGAAAGVERPPELVALLEQRAHVLRLLVVPRLRGDHPRVLLVQRRLLLQLRHSPARHNRQTRQRHRPSQRAKITSRRHAAIAGPHGIGGRFELGGCTAHPVCGGAAIIRLPLMVLHSQRAFVRSKATGSTLQAPLPCACGTSQALLARRVQWW